MRITLSKLAFDTPCKCSAREMRIYGIITAELINRAGVAAHAFWVIYILIP